MVKIKVTITMARMIKMTVKPLDGGRWVKKSMEMSSHTPVGVGSSCSRPAMRLVLDLFC